MHGRDCPRDSRSRAEGFFELVKPEAAPVQVAVEASRVCLKAARVRPRALDAENDLVPSEEQGNPALFPCVRESRPRAPWSRSSCEWQIASVEGICNYEN